MEILASGTYFTQRFFAFIQPYKVKIAQKMAVKTADFFETINYLSR